jgi:L-glyceraldehyde 3-phosphate reductase
LYVGISNYPAEEAARAIQILSELGTPCLIHQPKYSMFERWVEGGLLNVLEQNGVGCIAFSPLAQGLLTNKYLHGIPEDSRAHKSTGFLQENQVTPEAVTKAQKLNELAQQRGQTLAQLAIAWLLKDPRVTSVLIGVSKRQQLMDCLGATNNTTFSQEELNRIEEILKG